MSGPPMKGPYDPDAIHQRVEREAREHATDERQVGLLDADRHLPDCDAPYAGEPCTCVSRAEAMTDERQAGLREALAVDDEMASVRVAEQELDRALFKARITGDEARSWASVRVALERLHQRGPGDSEDAPDDARCTSCGVVWPCPTGAILYDSRGMSR